MDDPAGALDEDELIAALEGVDLLGIRSKTQVTARVLEAPAGPGRGRRLLHRHQPDRPRRRRRAGASRCSTRRSPTPAAVVELAIAEIIALARRLTERDKALHAGIWDKSATGSHEIRGRTLGIVGYGNIGTQLSVLAETLGMRVVLLRHRRQAGARQRPPLLVARRAARHRRDRHPARRRPGRQRRHLRRRAVRPDAAAVAVPQPLPRLRRRLRRAARRTSSSGHIAGAAVDVFPDEPKSRGDAFESAAARPAQRDPHPARRRLDRGGAGGHRPVRRRQAARLRAQPAARRCRSTCPRSSPAAPRSSTGRPSGSPTSTTTPRACSPRSTSVLAEHDVNIDGQVLATRGHTGYVVTDTGSRPLGRRARRAARHARDGPAAGPVLTPSSRFEPIASHRRVRG